MNCIFWNSVWTKLWVNFVKYFKRIRSSFFSPWAKKLPFFANFSPILCPLFSPGKIGTSNLVHDCTWHSKVNQMEFCRLLWRSFFLSFCWAAKQNVTGHHFSAKLVQKYIKTKKTYTTDIPFLREVEVLASIVTGWRKWYRHSESFHTFAKREYSDFNVLSVGLIFLYF